VHGLNLHQFLCNQPLSEDELRCLLKQIIGALVFCHNNQVAHRDLTTANIMVYSADGQVHIKLIDFGWATAPNFGLAFCSTFCGTREWCSEQVRRTEIFWPLY
jgi:serine/threonine protein kinase